ncbi:hypothetical protein KP509_26G045700 [Ceratopteris richardii]|nr:hypothetical protein KP509_26G045700 [Ceratopteris richardii]
MALKTPKGFGPPAPKSSGPKPLSEEQKDTRLSKTKRRQQEPSDDFEDEGEEDEDDEIPQIVMDRMIKRIGVSLTVPLILGVSSFAMFWYLRVVLKFDIPEWLPLLVSGTFFGSSALGISYGILSTSWDPNRDGSFLGWKEAKANWPIFFDNLQGKQGRR